MNKILTVPKEISDNQQVFYAGNHYISIPEINMDGSVKSLNLISKRNKALIELSDEGFIFQFLFFKDGQQLEVLSINNYKDSFYIPCFDFELANNEHVEVKIFADLREKGFIYQFLSTSKLEIKLITNINSLNYLRFNSHKIAFQKEIKIDKWLHNPAINLIANNTSMSLAFGGERDFTYSIDNNELTLQIDCERENSIYCSINSDMDGASTTLIHLKRKGYKKIYDELKSWLDNKKISYAKDERLEAILNENLFFNYFFAVGKDMETDSLIALTSRSPRYYVSGAFWERDSFLWSFPAIKLIDEELLNNLVYEMIQMHSKNAGDHAHYIDGTVLYPGFELDEAASYFILLKDYKQVDEITLKAIKNVINRIEQEFDERTGLYKTFLLPSDDPSDYPFVTIDNVILWRGFQYLKELFINMNLLDEAEFIQKRIDGIYQGIYKYLVREIDGVKMFVWSGDGDVNYLLYNDPPGNLGLLYHYQFVDFNDEIFKNTISFYYSPKYHYYFADANIRELACDHHPNTPSGLGLCGSLLNPLLREEALAWLSKANMDFGLLAESFDKNTGEAKTGVGFATGSGYLAYALYVALIKER